MRRSVRISCGRAHASPRTRSCSLSPRAGEGVDRARARPAVGSLDSGGARVALLRSRSRFLLAASPRSRSTSPRSPAASSTRPTSSTRDARGADRRSSPTLEAKTTDQLVVVTLKSLQGTSIEDFGYQLGRHWQIGQKDKNNGVLLIVAPNERKVRIEVGYGLEGTLTDAVSRLIIENAIIPRFRANDFAGGITRGVDDIISVLTGDAEEWKQRAAKRPDRRPLGSFMLLILLLVFAVFAIAWSLRSSARTRGRRSRGRRGSVCSSGSVVGGLVRLVVRLLRRRVFGRRWFSGGGGGSFGGGGVVGKLVKELVSDDLASRQSTHRRRHPRGRGEDLRRNLLRHRAARRATIGWCRSRGRPLSRSSCRCR